MTIVNVSCDLPFGRNYPQNFADDRYIKILKNELLKQNNKKVGHCD